MAEGLTDDQMAAMAAPAQAPHPGLSDDEMQAMAHPASSISPLESGISGAVQGGSLGFADELAGGTNAVMDTLSGSNPMNFADIYRQRRDEARRATQDAQQANPGSFLTGELAGGVGSAFVPGLNVAKGVKGAAALGGLMALGQSQADLTKGEFAPAAMDVAKGAALGGATGYVGGKIANAIKGSPEALDAAANKAQYGVIGAGAKDIERDLGLGRTKFPGKAGPSGQNLERGMAQTIRNADVASVQGGMEGVVKKLDSALEQNRSKYGTFFDDIDNQVAQVKAQNPQGSIPTQMGTKIEDNTAKGSLSDQFNGLIADYQSGLDKRLFTSGAKNAIEKDASTYAQLLKDSDYDLRKLNEVKQALGKQLADTDWYRMPPEMAPQKDIIRKTYGLVKGRMEDLADQVSPGAGQTMKQLNQEFGNLATARGIAFKEQMKHAAAPMMDTVSAGAIAGMAALGHGPAAVAGFVGKKAVEAVSGFDVAQLSRMAGAKTLDGLAKVMQAATDPESQALGAKIYQLSQNPSVTARMSSLSELMTNPTTRPLMDQHLPEAPKDIQPKTPLAVTGGGLVKNAGYNDTYSADKIGQWQQRISNDMGSMGASLSHILEQVKNREPQSRNAMMFSLEQNPAYRPLLKKLKGEPQSAEE